MLLEWKISNPMKKTIYILILVLSVALLFWQTLDYRFLKGWDDGWQVLNGYTTNGLTLSNIEDIFSDFYYGQYSPLNQLSYTIVFLFNGLSPKGFHFASLLWHVGYVCMLFLFLDKLLHLFTQSAEVNNTRIAFIVALLTAVHPVQIESVAWISASKVLSCSFFFISALLSYLCYLEGYKLKYYVGAILLFICAFLCKEQALIFPLCLILLDWFVHRRLTSTSIIIEKLPFIALSGYFLLITFHSYNQTLIEVVVNEQFYTFTQRIAFSGFSLIEYLQKLLLPVNLMYIYPYPMDVGESLPLRFWLYPFVIPVFGFILWYFRKEKIVVFGSLFFLVQLSFFLHIIPLPRFAITANRYLYMASLGFFFPVVWYGYYWIVRKNMNKKVAISLFVVFFLCMGFYSSLVCDRWRSDRMLKEPIKTLLKERDNKSINQSLKMN